MSAAGGSRTGRTGGGGGGPATGERPPSAATAARRPTPVLLYYAYNRSFTGGPRTVLRLLRGLDRSRFRPVLASQVESPLTEGARRAGVETLVVPFPDVLDAYGERVLAYRAGRKLGAARALVKYNRRIQALSRARELRLVWARGVKSVLLTGLAARRLGVPLVWDIGLEKRAGGLVSALQWAGLGLAEVVVTQATCQRAEIFGRAAARLAAPKFTTIRPGVDPERLDAAGRDRGEHARERPGDGGFTILNVGSVHRRKNQLMLIRAAAGLVAEHPGLRVRVAGAVVDEAYARRLRGLAASAGCAHAVELLGWRDDVPELIRSSDVLVLCSRAEGVPTAVREAMYLGTPVVATAVGGLPEIIDDADTGFLVPRDDVERLRGVLRRCIGRPDELRSIAGRARERARTRYSVAEWTRRYNELLGALCASGRRGPRAPEGG